MFCSLWGLLSRLREQLETSGEEEEEEEEEGSSGGELTLQLIAECFRAQRNACVQSPRNQALLRELSFIEDSLKVIGVLHRMHLQNRDATLEPLRCGVQFLGNMAVGNQLCKDNIWNLSFPHLMLDLLSAEDEKVVTYASMVLHTCLDEEKTDCGAVLALASGSADGDEEALTVIGLLDVLCEMTSGLEQFMFLQDHAGLLEATVGKLTLTPGEALTVIGLLDVLCEMTSGLEQFMFLQDHAGLLEATVGLLQEIHAVGKASKNVFSSSQNFSSCPGKDDDPSSPSVSFKAHLIRLIGNLCHRHPGNQNQVLISQWAIFAIRNLLEQNRENQELVGAMDRRGNADYSALAALGLDVEERDGGLLLKTTGKSN
ncbi:hypothetical protein CRUP_006964 [Coryphaenoides rupestris]|nr:hypothetical protein CRUP_006964 [Coryphaenoides rupestris]